MYAYLQKGTLKCHTLHTWGVAYSVLCSPELCKYTASHHRYKTGTFCLPLGTHTKEYRKHKS